MCVRVELGVLGEGEEALSAVRTIPIKLECEREHSLVMGWRKVHKRPEIDPLAIC